MIHACAYRTGEGIEAKLMAEAVLCSAIARVIELKNQPYHYLVPAIVGMDLFARRS